MRDRWNLVSMDASEAFYTFKQNDDICLTIYKNSGEVELLISAKADWRKGKTGAHVWFEGESGAYRATAQAIAFNNKDISLLEGDPQDMCDLSLIYGDLRDCTLFSDGVVVDPIEGVLYKVK